MNICIDESGSFVHSSSDDSWNCVAAYIYPEVHKRKILEEVRRLLVHHGKIGQREVKLRDLTEAEYTDFLTRLGRWDGVLYAVATDAATNTPGVVTEHQQDQTRKILEHVDKMKYEGGREVLRTLARRVSELSHHLYVQMICQIQLVKQILQSALIYFVQRYPQTLSRFRWKIDQKNSTLTSYEQAYKLVLPAFVQSASLREPITMLEGENYRWFDRFYYPKGEEPTYLRDDYGINIGDDGRRKLNVGKLVREHVRFVDSRSDAGVQVADLLASGLRRCLRGQFVDNDRVASLIGRLTVQREYNQVPVKLVSLGQEERGVGEVAESALLQIRTSSRSMLVR